MLAIKSVIKDVTSVKASVLKAFAPLRKCTECCGTAGGTATSAQLVQLCRKPPSRARARQCQLSVTAGRTAEIMRPLDIDGTTNGQLTTRGQLAKSAMVRHWVTLSSVSMNHY